MTGRCTNLSMYLILLLIFVGGGIFAQESLSPGTSEDEPGVPANLEDSYQQNRPDVPKVVWPPPVQWTMPWTASRSAFRTSRITGA